jgi:hypothetical protein
LGFSSHRKAIALRFFQDMLIAWGLKDLPTIDKIGDYCFKMEFASEEDKVRIVEGVLGGIKETPS